MKRIHRVTKYALCLAGSLALTVLTALAAIFAVSQVCVFLNWAYDAGYLQWLYRSESGVFGAPPIFVLLALFASAVFVGKSAYRACRCRGVR